MSCAHPGTSFVQYTHTHNNNNQIPLKTTAGRIELGSGCESRDAFMFATDFYLVGIGNWNWSLSWEVGTGKWMH